MSVYKRPNSPHYHFDFQLKGHRFCGSTERTTLREAQAVEALERDKAKLLVKAMRRTRTSLLIDDVADRLWQQEAQHDARPDAALTNLNRLIEFFGKTKPLTDIDHAEARRMVAWRRGHRLNGRANAPLISASTVNRSATLVLQRLFKFAKSEGAVLEHEPKWNELLLDEPIERVRELQDDEAEALESVMRDDYAPFFAFVRASGLRQAECVTLRWTEVFFGTKRIVRTGKGGRRVTFPITDTIREILFPLQGNHPDFVFTYVGQCQRRDRVLGQRYPLTITGVESEWKRMRAKAGVKDFRFHDFRHDFATKLLRQSGNLKLVQKTLNHADIASTMKYAHVLDEDVAAAVERLAKSRTNPRTKLRKVI